jgi:hypothetical protein
MKNKNKKTKKVAKKIKKVAKKKVAKKANKIAKKVSQELVIRVQPQEVLPTVNYFLEPIHEGKNYSVVKTPFTIKQILSIIQPTPKNQIYTRPGKGGKKFTYVVVSYIEKKLNFLFGFMWDFDVVDQGVVGDFIWVKGKLTGKLPGGMTICKTQFGRAEIKYLQKTTHKPENMVDYGNDLKAAASDALKKCASLLGIAADVYGKENYQQETGVVVKEAPTTTVSVDSKDSVSGPEGEPVIVCSKCDGIMSQAESDFSMRLYKKNICRECQAELKKK